MIEVNVRNLKAGLSHYLKLMQAGELIAIKLRDHRVGFLSQEAPQKKESRKLMTSSHLEKLLSQLKTKGYIQQANHYRLKSYKPVPLKNGIPISKLIRQMRDEE